VTWLVVVALVAAAIVAAVVLAYQWTQTHYYVGVDEERGTVAIFQGVQQSIGPIPLSHIEQTSEVDVDDLPTFQRRQVEATINADDLRDAHDILERLARLAESGSDAP
jgi:protein phosphatase